MKILCVGMNYAANNFCASECHVSCDDFSCENMAECCQKSPLGNKELPHSLLQTEPVIYSKPDSAVIRKGMPFFIPDFAERFDYETEIVVKINRLGKDIAPRFASRYYEEVTVGIDFTARDLQQRLSQQNLPWELCKAFDQSAAIGQFVHKSELPPLNDLHFHLDIDGETVQQGHTADMVHPIDEIVSFCSRFFTLKMGDLIFTGTPAGVGPVRENQLLTGYIEEREVLRLKIK